MVEGKSINPDAPFLSDFYNNYADKHFLRNLTAFFYKRNGYALFPDRTGRFLVLHPLPLGPIKLFATSKSNTMPLTTPTQ